MSRLRAAPNIIGADLTARPTDVRAPAARLCRLVEATLVGHAPCGRPSRSGIPVRLPGGPAGPPARGTHRHQIEQPGGAYPWLSGRREVGRNAVGLRRQVPAGVPDPTRLRGSQTAGEITRAVTRHLADELPNPLGFAYALRSGPEACPERGEPADSPA